MVNQFLQKLKDQTGAALLWSAAFFTVAIGLMAMCIDVGYAYIVSNELKAAADAGSLTAASSYLTQVRNAQLADGEPDPEAIREAVVSTVNAIIQRSQVINSADDINVVVQFGEYDFASQEPYDESVGTQFTDLTEPLMNRTIDMNAISAFRVQTNRGQGGSIPLFFSRALGLTALSITRHSVATLSPRTFMLTIDTSGSMDDISYVRTTSVDASGNIQPPAPMWPAEENFVSRPPIVPTLPILFSPHAPAPSAFIGYETIRPEPLQTVLDSSLTFLEGLIERSNLGDSAGVTYFSTRFASKVTNPSELIVVNNENIESTFRPLLANTTLYGNLVPGGAIPADPHYVLDDDVSNFDYDSVQYEGPIAIPEGETNMGGAIAFASSVVNNAEMTTRQSIPVIILFTDGVATCAPNPVVVSCFGSNPTPEQLQAAREYTFAQAQEAIIEGIRIYPISYGTLDGQTSVLLDEIALLSGLDDGHFRIGTTTNPAEIETILQDIFEEIAQLIPFSLAG